MEHRDQKFLRGSNGKRYERMTHNVLKIQKEIWGRQENEKLCLKLTTFTTVGEIHKYINKPYSAFICQRNFFFFKRGWDGQRGRDTGSPLANAEGQ